jgi:hypothetical protein
MVRGGGASAVEQPILLLGGTGFAPAQRAVIEALLARPALGPKWRLAPFRESDAWWLHGAKSQLLPDGHVRVGAGLPTEHALNLDLGAVDRPVAFSLPLASPDLEPRCVFSLADEASMRAALLQFEEWLRTLTAQFALGAMVMRRGTSLRQTVHELHHGGRLLAVLDYRQGRVAIHPEAGARELWAAQWLPKEEAAARPPTDFVRCTPGQLLWAYVRRCDRDLLPERYRTATIYFRHSPRVPLRWLRDSQLALVRELSAGPGDFAALLRRTGSSDAVLAMDLSCLYYTGAVTTTADKAANVRSGGEEAGPDSVDAASDGWLQGPAERSAPADLTVPAALLDPEP